MADKPITFGDCIRHAADALKSAEMFIGDSPAARDLIEIAGQWMNLARLVPPSYPPAVPQPMQGYGYNPGYLGPYPPAYPQVPDFPPGDEP